MDNLTPPIPYYSGKRSWVKPVWDRLGNPDVYLEPCGGDLAVLLGRPHNPKLEVVCDTSGLVSNFWRAIRNNPEGVALEADYPTIHQDLTARQKWLMEWAGENAERLSQNPEYFDTKAAGWWGWGASSWLGSEWCLKGNKKPPKAPNGSSQGIQAQGIQAQRIELEGEIGTGERLMPWFKALARRLSRVVVLNQDWKAALTPATLQESRRKDRLVGIFLDGTLDQTRGQTAEETWEWARWMGEKYRIAYACREGEMATPRGWEAIAMEFGDVSQPYRREDRDMVLFSPTCIVPQPSLFGPDF